MLKMLYIASQGLGENIFAAPAMEFLSGFYELHFVIQKSKAIFFKQYRFITKIVEVSDSFLGKSGEAQCLELRTVIDIKNYAAYYSHNSNVINKLQGLGIPAREHAKENILKLSCAEQYLLRAGGDPSRTDCRYTPVAPISIDNKAKIVLYTGSREVIRRMPLSMYSTLSENLAQQYSNSYSLYTIHGKEYPKTSDKFTYIQDCADNSQEIIKLFSSGANLMIGPDSGLTHVALSFNIPQIWLETRDREEMAIPAVYSHIVKVCRATSPDCLQNCRARTHLQKYGSERLNHCPHIKEATSYKGLVCVKSKESPCLLFNQKDYSDLFAAIAHHLNYP